MAKKIALTAIAILIATSGAACIHTKPSAFYANFSLQQLANNRQTPFGLDCGAKSGGGGGGRATSGGLGVGPREYHLRTVTGFECNQVAAAGFDEVACIAALKREVESNIYDSGGKIIDRGNPDGSSFYFTYSVGDAQGRLEVSGRRITDNRFALRSDLDEKGVSR